jgi:hypothetical protein
MLPVRTENQELAQLHRKDLRELAKLAPCTRQELLLIFQFCDCELALAETVVRKLGVDCSSVCKKWV